MRGVDVAIVWQYRGKWAVKQSLLLECEKIGAVQPDEIDRTFGIAAGRLLGNDAGDRFRRIAELDVTQRDAIAPQNLSAGPFDEGIGLFVAGPGIEVDDLAARVRDHIVP